MYIWSSTQFKNMYNGNNIEEGAEREWSQERQGEEWGEQ